MNISRFAVFAAFVVLPVTGVSAGVTATGNVSPNPPGEGDFVQVGVFFGGPFPEPGSLTVDNGSVLPLEGLQISEGVSGEVTVTGSGSALTTLGSLFVGGDDGGGPDLRTARLSVLSGGRVEVDDNLLLSNAGQLSFVTVSGVGSQLIVEGDFGGSPPGLSSTTISKGGLVSVGDDFAIAGRTTVDGAGSTLSVGSTAVVDEVLRVTNGASFFASQLEVLPSGRVGVDGGSVTLSSFNGLDNVGLITGSGRFTFVGGGGTINNQGRIEARSGEELVLASPGSDSLDFRNFGEITADGGTIEILGSFQNELEPAAVTSVVTLRDGQLRVASDDFFDIQNQGRIAAVDGVNDLFGSVSNPIGGQIAVTNDSTLIFHDNVLNNGGQISVLPGSTAVFLGNVNSQFGTFQANLAGTDDDTGFGTAEVVGEALLGTIDVAALSGFEPAEGDSFTLLTASSIAGDPTLGDVPKLAPGLAFELNATSTALELLVVAELAGDTNFDGIVDAADFVTARDTGGSVQDVQANFGSSLADSAVAVNAVPEPTGGLLLAIAALSLAARKRSGMVTIA